MAPTPLVDFFKRGEVARDVRLAAAQGALAPRAHEQLAILVLLLEDSDPEIRAEADRTLGRIPVESLQAFLGRSDVPIGMREFFADRGVFPAETPAIVVDDPLIDTDAGLDSDAPLDLGEGGGDARDSTVQQLARMGFSDRLKAAIKGSREMRAILIRDPNKMIAAAVLSSPKVNESEVESFARMASVSEDVLRIIGTNRAWTKNYGVIVGLAKNPKTPIGMSLNLMPRLNSRDLAQLSVDRNVPEALRIAARKRIMESVNRS